jgi:excisionase family DNA binding protein
MNATITLPDELIRRIAEAYAELASASRSQSEGSTFVTPDAAATEILGCKRQRVYDLLSSGALTRYKDGSRTLLKRSEVEEYVLRTAEVAR